MLIAILPLVLTSEAYAACAVVLANPVAGAIAHNSPPYTWNADPDCVAYRLQITAGAFTPAEITESGWIAAKTWQLPEATWEAKIASTWSESVRWRVEARDSAGTVVRTPPRTLRIDADGDAWAAIGGDCDDTDASINPAAAEVCADGIDNDCEPPGFRGVHIGTNNGVLFYAGYDIAADPTAIDEYLAWIDTIHANWVGIYVAMQYTNAVDTSFTMTTPTDAGATDEGAGTWTWDDDVLIALTTQLKAHTGGR